jgi:hypothetical protein
VVKEEVVKEEVVVLHVDEEVVVEATHAMERKFSIF